MIFNLGPSGLSPYPNFTFTDGTTTYTFDSTTTTSSVSGVYYFYRDGTNWEFYMLKNGTLTINGGKKVDIFSCGNGNSGSGRSGGSGGTRKTHSGIILSGPNAVVIAAASTLGVYASNATGYSQSGARADGGYSFDDSSAKGPDGNSRRVGAGGGTGAYSYTDGTSQGSGTVAATNGGNYGGGNGGDAHIDGAYWYANNGSNGSFYGAGGGGAGYYEHTGPYVDRSGSGTPGSGYQGFLAIRNAR